MSFKEVLPMDYFNIADFSFSAVPTNMFSGYVYNSVRVILPLGEKIN